MGVIKAITNSVRGLRRDLWLDYFPPVYLPESVLLQRGVRKSTSGKPSSLGSRDVITDGSVFCVSEGQAAVIVENGAVLDVVQEAGEYEYRSTRPSGTAQQKLLYVNLTVCYDNPLSGGLGIPVRIRDKAGEINGSLRYSGSFDYRVSDPALFYREMTGAIPGQISKTDVTRLLTDRIRAMLLGMAEEISRGEVQIPLLGGTIRDRLTEELAQRLGVEILTVCFTSVDITDAERVYAPAGNGTRLTGAETPAIRQGALSPTGKLSLTNMPGAKGFSRKKEDSPQPEAPKNTLPVFRFTAENLLTVPVAQKELGMVYDCEASFDVAYTCTVGDQMIYDLLAPKDEEALHRAVQDEITRSIRTCLNSMTLEGVELGEMEELLPKLAEQVSRRMNRGFLDTYGLQFPSLELEGWQIRDGGRILGGSVKPAPVKKTWICTCGRENEGRFCMSCGEPGGNYRYHCAACGWEAGREIGRPRFCPDCGTAMTNQSILFD